MPKFNCRERIVHRHRNQRTLETLAHGLELLLAVPNLHQQVLLIGLRLRQLPAQRVLELGYAPALVLLLGGVFCLELIPYLRLQDEFGIVHLHRDAAGE